MAPLEEQCELLTHATSPPSSQGVCPEFHELLPKLLISFTVLSVIPELSFESNGGIEETQVRHGGARL